MAPDRRTPKVLGCKPVGLPCFEVSNRVIQSVLSNIVFWCYTSRSRVRRIAYIRWCQSSELVRYHHYELQLPITVRKYRSRHQAAY